MEGNMMENGKIIKWKDMVYSHGKMDENTKGNTKTIKRKDMELLIGQM
jgi:hypothetical protein